MAKLADASALEADEANTSCGIVPRRRHLMIMMPMMMDATRECEMLKTLNIYCDESCHLEHDGHTAMLLGAVGCPLDEVRSVSEDLRAIKRRHRATAEMKWVKVSPARLEFYREVWAYFYQHPRLTFRCLCLFDKRKTAHADFNQSDHDAFYYEMYYYLLGQTLSSDNRYNIYIDIKDSRSQRKIEALRDKLHKMVANAEMISRIQHIRARESEVLQLTDFLLGIISYAARGEATSAAKQALVKTVEMATGVDLPDSTVPWAQKFNLMFFAPPERAKEVDHG